MVLGKLPVSGFPTLLMIVGQRPTALVVCADGVVWTFLLLSIFSLLFLPLFERRPDILSQRAVKPKTTNQPTKSDPIYTRQNKYRRNFYYDIDDFRYYFSKENYFQLVAQTFIRRNIFYVSVPCLHVQLCTVMFVSFNSR